MSEQPSTRSMPRGVTARAGQLAELLEWVSAQMGDISAVPGASDLQMEEAHRCVEDAIYHLDKYVRL